MPTASTTILISNLHCSSCVNTIRDTLLSLSPTPISISTSIVSQSVLIEHEPELTVDAIKHALDDAGFDLVSTPQFESYRIRRSPSYFSDWISKKKKKHTEQCLLCQQDVATHEVHDETFVAENASYGAAGNGIKEELSSTPRIASLDLNTSAQDALNTHNASEEDVIAAGPFKATYTIGGMTCASCVGNVSRAVSDIPGVTDVAVNLVEHYATAIFERKDLIKEFIEVVGEAGYECELISVELAHRMESRRRTRPLREEGPYRAIFSVAGMTCASCIGNVTKATSALDGVSDVAVNLVGKSATAVLQKKELTKEFISAIEDGGYKAELVSIRSLQQEPIIAEGPRSVSLRVEGMFCQHCPTKIMDALAIFGDRIQIDESLSSYNDPKSVMRITYTPSPPDFTIRHIISTISSAKSPPFEVSIEKLPSIEERARLLHAYEQRRLLIRLLSAFILAIPTFIVGIAFMTLVPASNTTRMWFMAPLWTGNTSRAQWVLFFLATPAMFFSAAQFHRRSIKEIYTLWRPGSGTPVWRRFVRFGSMNLLISMGVSIAYFASIILLALAAVHSPDGSGEGDSTTYFDSVVFLTMFLLAGRYLEAYSKGRTADAVTALGALRPAEALLLVSEPAASVPLSPSESLDLEKGMSEDTQSEKVGMRVQTTRVDLLEIGDIVRVPHGATPPADAMVVSGQSTQFDESFLTGESKPIKKSRGDQVFVGTINRGKAVEVKVTALGGETMLDQIVNVVREGQTRRAPIEKLADVVTSFFVPIVTLLAILTFIIWLVLGVSGALPRSYLDIPVGGWPVWALQFAIAVFVIACPCGVGLAAPTALLVGSGLAAKLGILVRGGGEAFQEAAQLDIVVFDKTGTLTEGGEPRVTDEELASDIPSWNRDAVLSVAYALESASSHPLAIAIRVYCEGQDGVKLSANSSAAIEEIGGRGLKGKFSTPQCDAIIGNQQWIEEHGAIFSVVQENLFGKWQYEAKSVIALAIRKTPSDQYFIVGIFAATDKIRPEAPGVVAALQGQGLGTWMISGDNANTAKAVARTVGIPETNVIAGVLPHQKAEQIARLQQVGKKRDMPRWKQLLGIRRLNERCVVAMVGDGINDAPALSAADVGVAVGSGSDVAISSASFILIKSDLRSILTLSDLSRTVFRRVKFNFLWAFMYNIAALPIAAGVIYPAGNARLDPVWASLAMALSSVSVVLSSLLLRLYREPQISISS